MIKYLPELATALLVALICGALANGWHKLTVLEDQAHERAAISAQIASDTSQCNMDKQLTENANDEYQKQISDLDRQLSDARMRRPRTCVIPLPSALAASRFNAAAATRRTPVATGITSDALLAFEGTCQREVIKLTDLQNFAQKVWKENGQ